MKVEFLIEALLKMPKDAEVVIGNESVNSVELEHGRMKIGHMVDSWSPLDHGNKTAVRFTRLEELSDGVIISRKY